MSKVDCTLGRVDVNRRRTLTMIRLSCGTGRVPDLARAQVLTHNEMIHAWMAAKGEHKPVFHIPMPGGLSKGFRGGYTTAPNNAYDG